MIATWHGASATISSTIAPPTAAPSPDPTKIRSYPRRASSQIPCATVRAETRRISGACPFQGLLAGDFSASICWLTLPGVALLTRLTMRFHQPVFTSA